MENRITQPGDPAYPSVPDKEDLIGFVTTGNFDLGQGKASAIGCVAVEKVRFSSGKQQREIEDEDGVGGEGRVWMELKGLEGKLGKKVVGRLCVVRDAGMAVGRLARWELV